MKKKSASQSAFLNPRVLIGLFIVLVGACLALAGFGAFSAFAQGPKNIVITNSHDPLVPNGFDCSKIRELGIDRQENFRAQAIMIACGQSEGGSGASSFGKVVQAVKKLFAPLMFGASDVNLVTGTETSPNITQSETYTAVNPDDPNQIFVAYNDSRGRNQTPINISGASISTDGGTTFTRLTTAGGQSPFSGTVGDPVALYNKPTGTWFTVWLDTTCGSQGLGGYKSSTPANAASWTHFCVHNASSDDRESGWADNNPASPFYGRMYITWGNSSALTATYSSDNGATWHAPITVAPASPFIRDVQVTGDMSGNGVVYLAGMNEGGGGFPHTNVNHIFKSTDGGNTWSHPYTGPGSAGPGVILCTGSTYFACMFSDGGGYWRHEGWGEPAAFNNVVSLVYAQHGAGSDAGDVYYVRSTDGGATFAAPFKLNSDATTRPQWQPNLSVSPTGTLFATWYDARDSASCTRGNPGVPCYRIYSRKSNDNGANWLPDDALSDVVSPLPAQNDPGVQATYAGDYDYGSAVATRHVTSWTDGRVAIGGSSQQDAFTDRELVGFSVTTANPGCSSVVFSQPTDFVVNLTDPVTPGTVQASDFSVNGTPADNFVLSNGNATITFHFNSSPVTAQGVQTMHIAAGAFNRVSDNQGNLDFTCTFRYDALLLQVTSTLPPVGGQFSPAAPNTYMYDVHFNEAVDPASVQTSDLTLSGTAGASVTGVTVLAGNTTARFTIGSTFGGSLTASIPAGAITDQAGNPGAAFTGNYTIQGCPPTQYVITPGADPIVAGTTDTGNHTDDGDTSVALPFPFKLYGNTYNSVNVNSNGRLDFVVVNETLGYQTACLPAPPNQGPYDYTIFPLWQDLRTDSQTGCSGFPGGVCGIFTSVSGVAPNRIFNIEWRAVTYNTAVRQNFEARLYENSVGTSQRFDVILSAIDATGATHNFVSGVQGASGFVTQDFCANPAPVQNVSRAYAIPVCAPAPVPSSAVSRKTHGAAGDFDIPLPLSGTPGIECRNGQGAGTDHKIVVTFANPVTVSSASVTTGTGSVSGSPIVAGNVVTVNLTGVTNAQTIIVTLSGVNDGVNMGDVVVPMSVLNGDTSGNGSVTGTDVTQTKSQSGQAANATNFREDVVVNGAINGTDLSAVKLKSGTALP